MHVFVQMRCYPKIKASHSCADVGPNPAFEVQRFEEMTFQITVDETR